MQFDNKYLKLKYVYVQNVNMVFFKVIIFLKFEPKNQNPLFKLSGNSVIH